MASLFSLEKLEPVKLVLSLSCSRLFKSFCILVLAILQTEFGGRFKLPCLVLLGIKLAQNILTSLKQLVAFLLLPDSVVQTLLSDHVVLDLLTAPPDVTSLALTLDLDSLLDLR